MSGSSTGNSTDSPMTNLPPGWPNPLPPNVSNATAIPVIMGVMFGMAVVAVMLRFFTRACIINQVGLEDWLILSALIFSAGCVACTIELLRVGLGQHIFYVFPTYPDYIKWNLAAGVTYVLSHTCTKISILWLYTRILTYRYVRLLGRALLVVVIISHTWIVVSIVTSCIPLQSLWDFTVKPAVCYGPVVFWTNGAIHIATDFAILVLPIPVVMRMMAPWRHKVALLGVFALGFGICFISIMRIILLLRAVPSNTSVFDVTWNATTLMTWNIIEITAAIICTCLMTLKPLLTRIFPRLLGPLQPVSYQHSRKSSQPVVYNRPLTIGTRPTRAASHYYSDSTSSATLVAEDSAKSPSLRSEAEFPIYSNVSLANVRHSPTRLAFSLDEIEASMSAPLTPRRPARPSVEDLPDLSLAMPSAARVKKYRSVESLPEEPRPLQTYHMF